jgi:hypothetical protein
LPGDEAEKSSDPQRSEVFHQDLPRVAAKSTRSALAWVYAGEHGPCGGIRVPTPSTASEKALPAIASSPPTLAAALETARAPSAPLSAADCLRLVEALQSVPDPRRARAVVTVGNRCFGLLCRR